VKWALENPEKVAKLATTDLVALFAYGLRKLKRGNATKRTGNLHRGGGKFKERRRTNKGLREARCSHAIAY